MFHSLGLNNLDKTLTLNPNQKHFLCSWRPVCFFNRHSFRCETTNTEVQRYKEGTSNGIGVTVRPSAVTVPTSQASSHAFWPHHRDIGFCWFCFDLTLQPFCSRIKLPHILMEILHPGIWCSWRKGGTKLTFVQDWNLSEIYFFLATWNFEERNDRITPSTTWYRNVTQTASTVNRISQCPRVTGLENWQ